MLTYLSCFSHCCNQYPARSCLTLEGLLLLTYHSRGTFHHCEKDMTAGTGADWLCYIHSQETGNEQKVGTSYQTQRPAPGVPLPLAGLHFLKFPYPRQSAYQLWTKYSNTGANGKHITSKSQQFLTEFRDLSPGYTQFCAGTRMQCSLV